MTTNSESASNFAFNRVFRNFIKISCFSGSSDQTTFLKILVFLWKIKQTVFANFSLNTQLRFRVVGFAHTQKYTCFNAHAYSRFSFADK
jgi:hypothetical protein